MRAQASKNRVAFCVLLLLRLASFCFFCSCASERMTSLAQRPCHVVVLPSQTAPFGVPAPIHTDWGLFFLFASSPTSAGLACFVPTYTGTLQRYHRRGTSSFPRVRAMSLPKHKPKPPSPQAARRRPQILMPMAEKYGFLSSSFPTCYGSSSIASGRNGTVSLLSSLSFVFLSFIPYLPADGLPPSPLSIKVHYMRCGYPDV
ncbi:hypothetical protein J3F83DRAFT_94442 [Trichoderma novae-zelandiae]